MTDKDQFERTLDMLFGSTRNDKSALQASRQKVLHALRSTDVMVYAGLMWDAAGTIWFAMSERGLVAVQMGDMAETDFVAAQEKRLQKSLSRDASRTDPIKQQLREYLTGQRVEFDIPIDWRHVSDFQAQVLRQAMQIPRGQVWTYGGLAQRIGKPKSARAVGRALGTNPMPIVIPCHRIIAADGSLTGYIGGVEGKTQLFQL